MKITLWQQFSSNHSASFTVVGVFEDADKAEEAARILRDVVERLHEYYRKRFPDVGDFIEWAEEIDIRFLSVFEIALRQQYKLRPNAWTQPPDWAYNSTPVHQFKHLVFVSSRGDTWSGYQPLDSLIKKAGGKLYTSEESRTACYLTVTCQAQNADSAQQLAEQMTLVEVDAYGSMDYVRIPETDLRFAGKIEQQGAQLIFKNLGLSIKPLEAIMPFLETQGCSDIQVKFTQK
jgi:hypothetical protein